MENIIYIITLIIKLEITLIQLIDLVEYITYNSIAFGLFLGQIIHLIKMNNLQNQIYKLAEEKLFA